MRRFELKEGSSSEFWEVSLSEDGELTVRFGRIGSPGQEKSTTFDNPYYAEIEHDRLIREKRRKGYQEVGLPGGKAVIPPSGDMLTDLRQAEPLQRVAAQLESLKRNSIRITTTSEDKNTRGASKLGGHPDLPPGLSWPIAKLGGQEIALPFIAQFDLAKLRPYDVEGLLPESGMLYFFYNREPYGPHGEDFLKPGNWRVFYHDGADGNYTRATPPIPIPPHMDYEPCAVKFQNEATLPHVETYYIGDAGITGTNCPVELTEEEWDAYSDLHYDLRANEHIHQMLGHADDIQPYALENSYQDVRDEFFPGRSPFKSLSPKEQNEEIFQGRLLLQVSREKSAKMEFGQGGRLFFFIRDQDLKARDFSKVWVNEQ